MNLILYMQFFLNKMNSHIDLSAIKDFGLTLDVRKKYHIVYDPQLWGIMHISNDLEDTIVNGAGETMEEYNDYIQKHGENWKGLFTNLSVWELLDHLSEAVNDKLSHFTKRQNRELIFYCIEENMRSYCY